MKTCINTCYKIHNITSNKVIFQNKKKHIYLINLFILELFSGIVKIIQSPSIESLDILYGIYVKITCEIYTYKKYMYIFIYKYIYIYYLYILFIYMNRV